MQNHDHKEETRHHHDAPAGNGAEQVTRPAMRGAWATFKAAFSSWKGHWKLFTGVSALGTAAVLASLVVGGIAAIAAILLLAGFSNGFGAEGAAGLLANPALLAILILAALLVGAAILVFSTWTTLATMTAWGWATREEHHLMSVRNAFRSSWSLVPGYIWISILSTLVVVMGVIGFVVPGILLALCFALLPAIAVAEGAKGGLALRRSIELSWPRLGAVTWRMIVAGIAVYAPGMILGAIVDGIFAPGSENGPGDLLVQLYEIVATPVFLGVVYATYLDLVAAGKKEARGGVKLIKIAAMCAVLAAVLGILIIAAF